MTRFDDLLTRCKRRNSKAMMELYNICAMPVYNASLHIVMNEFDAEEIMQDSILKAFDNIDRFLGTEKDFIRGFLTNDANFFDISLPEIEYGVNSNSASWPDVIENGIVFSTLPIPPFSYTCPRISDT